MEDYSHLDDDALEKIAWHDIPVAHLKALCSPWGSWSELDKPITQKEVRACLAVGNEALVETPIWSDLAFGRTSITPELNRLRHIQKIAWFVKHGFDDPITLEVGCQGLGVMSGHLVEDGNHRFAAAIMRKDAIIRAKVGGGLSDAQELELWAPNDAYLEIERRWEASQRARRRPKA